MRRSETCWWAEHTAGAWVHAVVARAQPSLLAADHGEPSPDEE